MTDKHDKLVEMALDAGFHAGKTISGQRYAYDGAGIDVTKELAAFAAAHVASLCADVEPVALAVVHEKEPLELFCNSSYVDFPPGEYNLYPASALAALAAERDALRTALEDLTSEAVEIWEYPADYPQIEHANELIAKYKAAALTKGQPAQHPQQEQPK